jgi:two-component system, NarL family, response regulator NreC
MKTDAADHLIDAVKALSEHKHFFTSRISEIVFARYIQGKKNPEGTPEKSRITDREREIVQLLAEGKSSKEIATILGISVRTVETHRAAIMKKLGLKSFSELIRYAVRNKIVEA